MSRFMMFVLPGDHPDAGPDPETVAAMSKFNEELQKAGALLALDGLTPPTEAARVTFGSGGPTVTDGPFAEAKEMVGGYWIIQARTRDEAVEWARRCPLHPGDTIEIRRIAEMEDYSDEVQAIVAD
jgi:hypothetical protein